MRSRATRSATSLTHLLVEQKMASFAGVVQRGRDIENRSAPACFINSVRDNMERSWGLTRTEGMLSSGARARERTSRRCAEARNAVGRRNCVWPGEVHEGFRCLRRRNQERRKTRRAARWCYPEYRSPDIVEFIECKMKEERKAHVLIEQGYDSSIDGDAYGSISSRTQTIGCA